MPQIKDIHFRGNYHQISIQQLIPYFGHNIRSLKFRFIEYLSIENLNALKNNKSLVELKLGSHLCVSQQIFDFICDNLTQLKSFGLKCEHFISLSKLIQLINLENFHLIIDSSTIDISLIEKNYCFNKLLTLNLTNIAMIPTFFENLIQIFPNIEKLALIKPKVNCEHQNNNQKCFECADKVFKCLSKLNRLKVLKIKSDYFLVVILKALQNNINEQTFKRLEELKIEIKRSLKISELEEIFITLINSLTHLCDRNPKQLITLEINSFFRGFISEKKLTKGTKFNVFYDIIPKNLRIIMLEDQTSCLRSERRNPFDGMSLLTGHF
jgi:hypothetical protein